MGLSLRGATSGAIDINAPDVAGDNTITLPPSNGGANQFFKNSGTAGIVTYSSMIETPTNRVSIGYTNPSAAFTVGKADGSRVIEIQGDDGVIRGYNRDSQDWAQIDFEASGYIFDCNAVERLRLESSGAITATGNFTTGGSIISEANPEASDTTNGAMLDKVKVIARNSAGQSVWLGYKNGTSGATSSINVDGDTTIRDLTARTVTSSDQVISNRSGTSVCFRAQDSGTDNLQILANGKVQSGSNYPDGDGVNIFAGGSIYIRQDGATGGVLRIRNGSDYKIELKGDGSAQFASTIWGGTTDSGASAVTTYASRLYNNSAFPTLYAKNSGNGGLWQGVNSSGTETSKINSDGSAVFAGAVKIGGTASVNEIEEYEEGTWTPVVSGFTVSGTTTITGTYVKVGRNVTVGIKFANTGTIAYGLSCFITLPFSMTSGSEANGLIGMLLNSNSASQDNNRNGNQCKLDGEGGFRFFVGDFTTTTAGQQLLFGGSYIAAS